MDRNGCAFTAELVPLFLLTQQYTGKWLLSPLKGHDQCYRHMLYILVRLGQLWYMLLQFPYEEEL